MRPQTPLTLAMAACLLLSAPAVGALGFGRVQAVAMLGSPLKLTLPVQLAAGERFDADCVQAQVQVGDRRVPPYDLRLSVAPGSRGDERLLQLSTLGPVDELVISVLVDSACTQRISRRFTLLSQPMTPAPGQDVQAAVPGTGGAASSRGRPVAAPSQRSAAPAAARTVAAHRVRPTTGSGLKLDRALPVAGALAAAALGATAAAPLADSTAAALVEAGIQTAVAQVAGDQIKALEQQVQQALTEARRQHDQLGQLHQRLAAAEAANRWLPWLLLGLVGCGALAIWLALRVRRLQREQARAAWAQPAAAPQPLSVDGDELLSGRVPLLSPGQPLLSRAADLGAAGPAAATQPALTVAHPMVAVAPPGAAAPPGARLSPPDFALGTGVPPRPVSVEELLDLDQQADFFLVLGQEQAAVDLLLSHVRSTGGTSALPYFKLLEIYRQQGDEEAYERTRERFNQRFNAFAPDWSGDLGHGRPLEDYPEVLQRLQRAWPQPLRAVAELESLLLRRADLEPFDLPAYRDVLMLHALVRDLPVAPVAAAAGLSRPVPATPLPPAEFGVDDSAVDLLLPLGDSGHAMEITVPRPHVAERVSAQAMLAEWVFSRSSPTATATGGAAAAPRRSLDEGGDEGGREDAPLQRVDLDLSDFAPAPREFTRPAAFTDVDLRRDSRLSDLAGFDDSDLLPPSISRR